jgi:2-keto-4-pentenoate hydratase/2-oxohepta-3-ene-1,7-dioic acid hydratase in catechol pathway
MYLATFTTEHADAVGVLPAWDSTELVDLTTLEADLPDEWRTDVAAILRGGPDALAAITAALAGLTPRQTRRVQDLELLSPIPRPGKVIGIGLNYRDHAEETGDAIPETPVVFAKFPTSVTGPYADITYPALSSRVDYEGELGVVIGRRTRFCTPEEARSAVGGYLVVNDVSARDVQNRTSQWTLGKSFDGFAPMGPWLATPDEIGDPHDLDISVLVNGEQRQKSNTSNLIFGVFDLISQLSQVCTLEVGDVIATGTPGGVGIGFTPERLLSPGDTVRVEIERLGFISSQIVAPQVTA